VISSRLRVSFRSECLSGTNPKARNTIQIAVQIIETIAIIALMTKPTSPVGIIKFNIFRSGNLIVGRITVALAGHGFRIVSVGRPALALKCSVAVVFVCLVVK